jgi:hypothetical protein
MSFDIRQLTGWVHDPDGIKAFAAQHGSISSVASKLIGGEERDVHLWTPLLQCKPSWRRKAQGIGDCVSWGAELAATMLMAIESKLGKLQWIEEAATEPIYGGCRVEVFGKSRGGRQDGAMGYAAADWLSKRKGKGGVILRLDHSKDTGIAEHNLTKYSKDKAKEWGDYGCGGEDDGGKLDTIARIHPIAAVTQVNTVEEAIAALTNGYPITIASSAGFGDMRRDADGLCYWTGSWAHQMMLGAIRWRNGKMQTRVFQSWGDSCSGPDPEIAELVKKILPVGSDGASLDLPYGIIDPTEFRRRLILPGDDFPYQSDPSEDWNPISACSWWIDEKTLSRILSTGDCWAFSGVEGFEPRKLDVHGAIDSWTK